MNEIQLFSLRRTIILSLLLGLFTMILIGQALVTGDIDDNKINDQTSSSSPVSSESSTSTAPPIQTDTQTVTQQETITEIFEDQTEAFADPVAVKTIEVTQSDAAELDSASLSGFGSSIMKLITFSVQYLFISIIFFVILAGFHILFYNSNELRNYINQSLTQAGFQAKISSFGKRWMIKGLNRKFNMKIMGFLNLRMKIELPKDKDTDPREFGLRRLDNSAITYCDLDLLPMRLQVVKMYLTKLE